MGLWDDEVVGCSTRRGTGFWWARCRRRSCLFVRVCGCFELLNGRDIYRAHRAVNFLARNDALAGCIVTM